MSGELVVEAALWVCGLFLLALVLAAARCAWIDRQGRKRAKVYRDRQLDCLQMLREEQEAARRSRGFLPSMRFGRSYPSVWRQQRPPAVPFDEDFGGTMAQRRFGHHRAWED